MDITDFWVKALYTYGPFALLVFFVIVAEGKARKAWKEAPEGEKVPFLLVVLAVWLASFLSAGFIVYAWFLINVPSERTITGTFENLENSETVATRQADLYLRKVYGEKGRFDYHWRLITPRSLPAGEKIGFTFDRSTCKTCAPTSYQSEFVVKSSFYTSPVRIIYDRQHDKLTLRNSGQDEILPNLGDAVDVSARAVGPGLTSTVWAQEPPDLSEFKARLEASDPIIRREARAELAKGGRQSLSVIEAILIEPSSPSRSTLGAIWALNRIPNVDQASFDPRANEALIDAATASDDVLRSEALRYVRAHPSVALQAAADSKLRANLTHLGPDAAASPQVQALARTDFELLYNLGVQAKDKYGSGQPKDQPLFQNAVEAFRKAWELRGYAAPPDRILFAKALFGWGLTLHDRSWITRHPDGWRNPGYVAEAKTKFQEFLAQFHDEHDSTAYPFPDHLKKARAYVANPVPESLQ